MNSKPSEIFRKLRRVKFNDLVQIWKLPVSLMFVPFYRMRYKNLWIVCEDKNEARDNGYWFFKICQKNASKSRMCIRNSQIIPRL